jgi:hypothetical protein
MEKNIEMLANMLDIKNASSIGKYTSISIICMFITEYPTKTSINYENEKLFLEWYKKKFEEETGSNYHDILFQTFKDYFEAIKYFLKTRKFINEISDKEKETLSDPTLYILAEQLDNLKKDNEKIREVISKNFVLNENVKQKKIKFED